MKTSVFSSVEWRGISFLLRVLASHHSILILCSVSQPNTFSKCSQIYVPYNRNHQPFLAGRGNTEVGGIAALAADAVLRPWTASSTMTGPNQGSMTRYSIYTTVEPMF